MNHLEFVEPWNIDKRHFDTIEQEVIDILACVKSKNRHTKHWHSVFEQISQNTVAQPLKLTDHVLFVSVPSAVHAQEYEMRFGDIWCIRMNEVLGSGRVTRIRFVVG